MFNRIKKSALVLAALGVFGQVAAHGRIKTWTITDHTGVTAAMPGQDYQHESGTARAAGQLYPYEASAQRFKDPKWLNTDGYVNVTDPDLACWSVSTSANLTYSVKAGSTVTTLWQHGDSEHWPQGHAGPIMEYMAACPDEGCDGVDAMTADWFKISESIEFNGKWASLKVMSDGLWSFVVPSELKKGKYLLRHEIMSVHGVEGTPQVYPFCIQIDLASSGTTVPKETYKFPGIYNDFDTTFKNFQIKGGVDTEAPNPIHEFVAPGPPVYDGSGGGNSKSKRTGTGAALNSNPGGATTGGATSTTSGTASAGASAVTDPYASSSSGPAISDSSAVSSLDPAAVATSSQAGAGASMSAPAGSASAGSVNPSAGAPSAAGPIASAGPSSASDANGAYVAPTGGLDLSGKAVVAPEDAGSASLEKPFPSQTTGSGDASASASGNASTGASGIPSESSSTDASGTGLAAGADAPAASVSSDSATSPATTGPSEYASNIQGGKCEANTWRCQKNADGKDFLEVCGDPKDGEPGIVLRDWVLSQPECPAKCDDSKPADPICQ